MDPYSGFLGKEVCVKENDGTTTFGVVREVTYNYVVLKPLVVITRRNVSSIVLVDNGGVHA